MAYELTYIVSSLMEKNDADAAGEKVRSFITDLGGMVMSNEISEKKKLSYPVKKQLFGYFGKMEFEMIPEKMSELETKLSLESDILRHMVSIKQYAKPMKPGKVRKPKAAAAPAEETSAPKAEKTDKGDKVKIEELDKKLEEILKD